MIAAGRDEQGARIAADRHVEAEHAVVEGLGVRELATWRCTWPITVPAGTVACGPSARGQLVGEVAQVQRQRGHLQLAVGVAPLLARAVAVELDAVAVGIGQVQRLADEVVGDPVQRPAGLGQPGQRMGEVQPRRIQDRQVIEAGGPPVERGRRRVTVQPDEVGPAGNPEGEGPVVGLAHAQAQRGLVERAAAGEV